MVGTGQRPPTISLHLISNLKEKLGIDGAQNSLLLVTRIANRLNYLEEALQKSRLKNRHYKAAVRGLGRCIFRLKALIHFPRFVLLETAIPPKTLDQELGGILEVPIESAQPPPPDPTKEE